MDQNKNKHINITYEPNNDSETLKPSLVVFPLNQPNISALNNEDQTQFMLIQNRDIKKRRDDKILMGETSKIIFDSKTKMTNNQSDYVIGIFSRQKREMKFVDIDSIFPMSHKVRRIEEYAQKMVEQQRQKLVDEIASGKLPTDNNLNTNRGTSFVDNKLQLIKDFGTAKAKKTASGIKSHMVNESNISSVNAVKKLLEDNAVRQDLDVKMNEEQDELAKFSTWKEILPVFDPTTKDKRTVFPLDQSKKITPPSPLLFKKKIIFIY